MSQKQFFKLTLVTHKQNQPLNVYLDFIATCAKSGITSVQLREKNLSGDALLDFGKQLHYCLQPFKIPLIINDNVQLAQQLDADGVHLGQSDGDVVDARRMLGDDKIIGVSVNSLEQLYTANKLPIDYVGVGAIFPTENKKNVETIWGIDGLKQVVAISTYPIVGIGGIDMGNVCDVMQAGVQGVAAIGVFHDAQDPAQTTKNLREIIEKV